MTGERRGWAMVAVMLPILTVNLVQLARHRVDLAEMWPSWRTMVLDLTLVIAGAVLIAAVVAGVHAWRAAKRVDHA